MSAKGLRSQQAEARASVIAAVIGSTTMRVVAVASPLPHIAMGTLAGIEGVTHVTVAAETLMYRDRGAQPTTL